MFTVHNVDTDRQVFHQMSEQLWVLEKVREHGRHDVFRFIGNPKQTLKAHMKETNTGSRAAGGSVAKERFQRAI